MNNEPVAWGFFYDDGVIYDCVTNQDYCGENGIPLYTHPAQELNAGGEPVKNATYWKRQYNEMSALNDRLKSSLYHANEQIKYLELHPAKTLTDEEIEDLADKYLSVNYKYGEDIYVLGEVEFARAILRKAKEK